jgi:hypothetical protein
MKTSHILPMASIVLLGLSSAGFAAPAYTITGYVPIGTDNTGSGNGISPSGNYATGFTQRSGSSNAIIFDFVGPAVSQANIVTTSPTHPFGQGLAVNDNGIAVGAGYSTTFFSAPLPLMWQGGAVTQLPFPANFTAGRANGVNNSNVAVGSASGNASFPETAIRFTTGGSAALTELTPAGGRLQTAYGISNNGDIVGIATNPATASANVSFYLPAGASEARVIPVADVAHNGGAAFGVSSNGRYVVGSSSFNGGSGVPFLYDATTDTTIPVPLPAGATSGSLRAVNDSGQAVGIGSGQFAVPFFFDGTNSYTIAELVNDPTWNIVSNTSSAAYSISNTGVITGRGFHNLGATNFLTAYYATPVVPEPTSLAVIALGGATMLIRRRMR